MDFHTIWFIVDRDYIVNIDFLSFSSIVIDLLTIKHGLIDFSLKHQVSWVAGIRPDRGDAVRVVHDYVWG